MSRRMGFLRLFKKDKRNKDSIVDEEFDDLRIPLKYIKLATSNFHEKHLIGRGGFGNVYKGEFLGRQGRTRSVAVKRSKRGHQDSAFLNEILLLSRYIHPNLVSLVGFCDESGENILVYKYESRGSLDRHLYDAGFTWIMRLRICVGVARGLSYLHNPLGTKESIIHRDVKSSNILLDENWVAKLADFGISKSLLEHSGSQLAHFGTSKSLLQHSGSLGDTIQGTMAYLDPLYIRQGIVTKKSDVYSFGVVLFEVLCGRKAIDNYNNERRFLVQLARSRFEEGKLAEIIDPILRKQMDPDSLSIFSTLAYECLEMDQSKRPSMDVIVGKIEMALELQKEFHKRLALPQDVPSGVIKYYSNFDTETEESDFTDFQFDEDMEEEMQKGYRFKVVEDIEEETQKVDRYQVVEYIEEEKQKDGRYKVVEEMEEEIQKDDYHKVVEDIEEEIQKDDRYKVKNLEHLRIPLEEIKQATSGFDVKHFIGRGGYGSVYRAELFHFDVKAYGRENDQKISNRNLFVNRRRQSTVAIKRLDSTSLQGGPEFLQEIEVLSCFRHQNLVSLLGFCDEDGEMIIVYEYAINGSLDKYFPSTDSKFCHTWAQRVQYCLDVAHGLDYLHNGVGEKFRIIHRDIKSSNILLGSNWEGKICDFGLSRIGPAGLQVTFVMTNVAGTL